MIRHLGSAFLVQCRLARRQPDMLQVLVTTPLFTFVILAFTEAAHRPDLAAYGVVAPTLMALWTFALSTAGNIITDDRMLGTLEGQLAAPSSLFVTVLGRMCAVLLIGLAVFAEAWLTAGLTFGRWLAVPHPGVLAACVLVTGVATAGTASLLASLFVLTPSARTVQNTLTYPFYLLSGVLVPIGFLPDWLQPLARVVFLYWSADLLRDSLATPAVLDVLPRLGVMLGLGAVGYAVGMALLHRVVQHARRAGTLSHS
ncbi:ABC transporter permease [Amycolatopsis sp. PS_44_ISF1]|uniref:ABC transporter permease n=1 Tax=Amycolatopsis sp. PS_44_ISF1 TaxID=2974917 RepID=UPI0028DF7F58|nr:ABC transporter permease [Amycolatopsis sp. PS_44_ISF1]MDT8912746.1 ABC transporter permease [Amycolatopsis sp. PS_44_ISF1]